MYSLLLIEHDLQKVYKHDWSTNEVCFAQNRLFILNYFAELDLRKRINDVKEIDRHMYCVCCDISEDISSTRIRIDYKMHRLNVFL